MQRKNCANRPETYCFVKKDKRLFQVIISFFCHCTRYYFSFIIIPIFIVFTIAHLIITSLQWIKLWKWNIGIIKVLIWFQEIRFTEYSRIWSFWFNWNNINDSNALKLSLIAELSYKCKCESILNIKASLLLHIKLRWIEIELKQLAFNAIDLIRKEIMVLITVIMPELYLNIIFDSTTT